MSKLDELIQELCPDGVEFKAADEIFNIRGGYTPSKNKPEFWTNGTVPWFRMEDIRENGRILSDSIQHINAAAVKGEPFEANSIIVATSATIGEHALITVPSVSNQRFTYLTLLPEYKPLFDIKFIFYYCFNLDTWCKNNVNEGNFASVDMKRLAKFKFPVPPLEVQREIVRILDNFTETTQKLEKQLRAELTARQKQYEYYRDKLLTFDVHGGGTSDIVWRTLGEIAIIKTGSKPENIFEDYETGMVEYINAGTANSGYVASYNCAGDTVTTPSRGQGGIGFVGYQKENFWLGPLCYQIKANSDTVLNKYLYFFLCSRKRELLRLKKEGGVPALNASDLSNLLVCVPPITVQKRLVHVLDNFDAICTDLSIGLPAEIEARQKQYEFYRDKLLTFAATGEIISEQASKQASKQASGV